MAVRVYGVNDPLTNKLYAKRLAVQSITQTYVQQFMGTSPFSLCQVRNDTMKAAGDRITIGLRLSLQGAGVVGGDTLEGNEESFSTQDDSIIIDKLRHAARVKGQESITQQRVPFDLREEALDDLAQWWADRQDYWFSNQLSGNTGDGEDSFGSDIRYTGLQATTAPDANHSLLFSNATADTEAEIETNAGGLDLDFKLNFIDVAVERAKRLSPIIRPIRIGGRNYYVCFVHTITTTQLRSDAQTAGNWFDIQSKALQGGEVTGNPLFTGALGVYNQTILHDWERLPPGATGTTVHPNVRRSVFCGAQAAWAAFGQGYGPGRFSWVEKLFDYDEELGVSAGCIGGMKAARFNSEDFAKIVISTRGTAATTLGTAT